MGTERKFVVTGTQVYGVATGDSDIDIVMEQENAHKLKEELVSSGIEIRYKQEDEKRQYNSCYYFNLGVLKFNIIHAKDNEELEQWEIATEGTRKLPPIEDREERLKIFNSFAVI